MSESVSDTVISSVDLKAQVTNLLRAEEAFHTLQRRFQYLQERLLALEGISEHLMATETSLAGLQYTAKALASEISFEKVVVIMRDDKGPRMEAWSGYTRGEVEHLKALSSDVLARILGQLHEEKAAFLSMEGKHVSFPGGITEFALYTFLAAPLLDGDQVIGALFAGYSQGNAYSFAEMLLLNEGDVFWFSALANQISAMVANRSLIQNLKQKTTELGALTQSLEQRVEERTSLLQATLNSTTDGILAMGNDGKIINFNQRFLKLWDISGDVLMTRDDNALMAYILTKHKTPDEFTHKIEALRAAPDDETFDIIELKDGQIFERSSRPQHLDNKSVGRVWSFLDVTERKRTEAAEKAHLVELERMNKMMIGRELKMAELKRELSELKEKLGLPAQPAE